MGGYCAPAFGRLISHRTFYGLHYMRRTAGQRLRTQRHPMGRLTKYAYPPPVTRCILTQFRRLLQAVLSHLMACGERFARSPTPLPYPTAASRVDV